jgi:galactonate dehydratase
MQPIADRPPVLPSSKWQVPNALPDVTLARVETWITAPARGGDGWSEVKPCLLVRLTTCGGTAGWGEAFVLPCREKAVAEIIHALGHVAALLQPASPWAFRSLALRVCSKHSGLDFSAATSALEMAMWDIHGKLAGQPLCDLLGGRSDTAIPIYANIWSDTQWDAGSLALRASDLVAEGYTAVKIHPMLNHSAPEAVLAVARVRGTIGDDIRLMVDMDTEDDPDTSLFVAENIAQLHPYWFEESVDGQDTNALSRIRRTTGMRVVTGEKHCGIPHFRSVLAADAADILNPDIAGLGGILDMLDLAQMADRQGVMISAHCWNSMTVAAAAMLHVSAAIPNPEMAEIYPEYVKHGARYATPGFHLDGAYAHLSDRPGLGVDIDTKVLRRLSSHYRSSRLQQASATR